jgi:predicted anti-sigma-YlaC factor YlaD
MSAPAHLSCEEFVELVTEYLEDALDPETHRRFDHHLDLCPGCVTYVDQIRETMRIVGCVEEEHLSDPARSHLLHAFRDWKAGGPA